MITDVGLLRAEKKNGNKGYFLSMLAHSVTKTNKLLSRAL